MKAEPITYTGHVRGLRGWSRFTMRWWATVATPDLLGRRPDEITYSLATRFGATERRALARAHRAAVAKRVARNTAAGVDQ